MKIKIPPPELQIDFSFALGQARTLFLQNALSKTLDDINIKILDQQLSEFVQVKSLRALAKHGLRGELLYRVPCLLEANPYLLGYYRLVLGFSQKEFYTTKFGVSGFKSMEAKGILSATNRAAIPDLCSGLVASCDALFKGIGLDRLSKEILDDLSLLILVPQCCAGAKCRQGAREWRRSRPA